MLANIETKDCLIEPKNLIDELVVGDSMLLSVVRLVIKM